MQKRNDKEQESETLFDRWLRKERFKKTLAQNDVMFFGVCVLFALYATQGVFAVQ